MANTVADIVVATLKAAGVQRVYGIPGDSLNGFTDALRREGGTEALTAAALTWLGPR
jgi:pyruvate dehydrogenase (quinone)